VGANRGRVERGRTFKKESEGRSEGQGKRGGVKSQTPHTTIREKKGDTFQHQGVKTRGASN